MSQSAAQIDHIIILLPHADVESPPKWLTDRFTISPGGYHADGKTFNKLILLEDASYIELIAFVDDSPARRAGHWWDLEYGIVDYALTDSSGRFDPAITQRLAASNNAISYDQPRRGGRKRPDGVQMEWEVTFPTGADRGVVPFWCHDVTPRDRRVPVMEAATKHPCGARGVHAVKIFLPEQQRNEANRALAAIIDSDVSDAQAYEISAPRPTGKRPSLQVLEGAGHTIELVLQVAGRAEEEVIEQKVGSGNVRIVLE